MLRSQELTAHFWSLVFIIWKQKDIIIIFLHFFLIILHASESNRKMYFCPESLYGSLKTEDAQKMILLQARASELYDCNSKDGVDQ